jgi:hypothetical protein
MAKRVRNKKKQPAKKNQVYVSVAPKQPPVIVGRRRVGAASGGMDKAARDYANLLSNPCSAPLVHPLYTGGDSGMLIRAESDFFAFNGATDTSGVLVWTPGDIGTGGLAMVGTVTENTVAILGDFTTNVPGRVFLQANGSAVRCVSACLQAYWPGSEQNRQGIIGVGQCPASWVAQGLGSAITTASKFRSESVLCARTPATHIEVKWRPGAGDMRWSDPNAADQAQGHAVRNAVQINVAGIPVATGLRIRLVAVYEYLPQFTAGIYNVQGGYPKSTWTFERVIQWLDSTGNWIYSVGGVASQLMAVLSSRDPTRHLEL